METKTQEPSPDKSRDRFFQYWAEKSCYAIPLLFAVVTGLAGAIAEGALSLQRGESVHVRAILGAGVIGSFFGGVGSAFGQVLGETIFRRIKPADEKAPAPE